MTEQEIKRLPTILDVIEQLAARENKALFRECGRIPSPGYYDEGRFNYVSDDNNRNIVHLMPTSQSPFTFMRGQSRYYEPCLPTLYRNNPTYAIIAKKMELIDKFKALLLTHPIFREVISNVSAGIITMAQHYGFDTNYIDITNSKWVAAFFACTGYDSKTDTYFPVGADYYEGYGVMYVTKDTETPNFDLFRKQEVIGYKYFARPTMQSSFGMAMEKGENFNDSPFFNKIFFRHNIEASKVVFDMSYKQSRYIPVDELSVLAKRIRDGLPAEFDQKKLAKDVEDWQTFGRADLKQRILPIIPFVRF